MKARSLLPILLAALLAGCPSNTTEEGVAQAEDQSVCATEDAGAAVDVNGVYDYRGDRAPYLLRGTITFEQTGTTVRVLDTTYANVNDRRLEGEGTIVGNRLEITIVPINGDTDYEADLIFLFGDGGDTFCVSFSDTNEDVGGMGSYRGTRQ